MYNGVPARRSASAVRNSMFSSFSDVVFSVHLRMKFGNIKQTNPETNLVVLNGCRTCDTYTSPLHPKVLLPSCILI